MPWPQISQYFKSKWLCNLSPQISALCYVRVECTWLGFVFPENENDGWQRHRRIRCWTGAVAYASSTGEARWRRLALMRSSFLRVLPG